MFFSFLPVIECSSRNVARPANQPPGPLVRLPQQNQCVCFATPASTVSLQRGGRFPLPPFLLVYSLAFLPRSSLAGSRNCALPSHSVTPGASVDPSRAGLIKRLARTRFERAVSHKGWLVVFNGILYELLNAWNIRKGFQLVLRNSPHSIDA